MFLGELFMRSANEPGGVISDEADALLGGSSDAPPPAPEQGTETPEDSNAVPYDRFKEVNDKLVEAKRQIGELEAKRQEDVPVPPATGDMEAAVTNALKKLGVPQMVSAAEKARLQDVRRETIANLEKLHGFNEQRDLPRIVDTMQAKGLSAVDAFKLNQFDGPPEQAEVAHDAPGGSAAAVETHQNPNVGQMQTQTQREVSAQARVNKLLGKPEMKKMLDL